MRKKEKKVPGHHVQVDVKFLTFEDSQGKKARSFQYASIDDATRVRALKIYKHNNQHIAIELIADMSFKRNFIGLPKIASDQWESRQIPSN